MRTRVRRLLLELRALRELRVKFFSPNLGVKLSRDHCSLSLTHEFDTRFVLRPTLRVLRVLRVKSHSSRSPHFGRGSFRN